MATIMKIHVILRTHDGSNIHNDWRERYCNLSKLDLIKGCFKSLVNSIKHVKNHDIQLTILDDHSTEELISFLNTESLTGFI